ncbi:MAG: hypothetical protein HY531_02930 [Chloroflexi bacterium]|nr:hypothetical protein [Chloroflexota bacterium]
MTTTNSYELALGRAIEKLVSDFQGQRERWWSERDLHWSLFYYLKQEPSAPEPYPTDYIRAEFPTVKKYPSSRGHYDLAILDPISLAQPDVRDAPREELWDVYLPKVKLLVAVEIKLWWTRRYLTDRDKMIDWDVKKLTDLQNIVQTPYFLNFVEMDFSGPIHNPFYYDLRQKLSQIKAKHPNLNVLCVPSEAWRQPKGGNWL